MKPDQIQTERVEPLQSNLFRALCLFSVLISFGLSGYAVCILLLLPRLTRGCI